jgi:NADH-quinone oxidoreductase subunit F
MMSWEPVLLRNVERPDSERIGTYLAHGGYEALKKALTELSPADLVYMVRESRLRGRGGAGFPTGLKWSFMPKGDMLKYVAVNCDEGEPGTFKDRYLVEQDPHQLIEGTVITAYAVGAREAHIYIRGEFTLGFQRLVQAIAEAYDKGFLGAHILGSGFGMDISVHQGAGAYICGEETALIESLEGKRGRPRLKPPYPAQVGLWGQPTLVQNVETLANIPHIVLKGAEWYSSIGTEESSGPKIYCVSGHVNRPGNYELPMGTPLREILFEHARGVRSGREIKAVIPGGASTSLITPEHIDVPMAFETLQAAGSSLGTGAIVVMDETTDMVEVARRTMAFFVHESCGHCTPCRVGSAQILQILERLADGKGRRGDLAKIETLTTIIPDNTFCPMGTAMVDPVASSLRLFRDEYEARIQ